MANFIEKLMTMCRASYSKLLEHANETREGSFVDVTIVANSVEIPANRLLLACCSPFFRKMFKTQMKKRLEPIVTFPTLDGKSVKTIIDFMYSGTITITDKTVLQLLATADYLQMDEVKQFCCEFLKSVLTLCSCSAVLHVSRLYRLESLQKTVYGLISANLIEFTEMDGFKAFSTSELVDFISNLDRGLAKETEVYQAIVTWTKVDEASRASVFLDLFQFIRLEQLPHQFLKTVVSVEDLVKKNVCANLVKHFQ